MTGLSVFVIAKNAARDITECLGLVRNVADEIVVVVDADSRDGTADAARAFTPRVLTRQFDGFSRMKQHALASCTREWALNLDADERPTPELLAEIQRVKTSTDRTLNGYAVNRLPYFLGKPIRHGGWFPDWVLRLVRREGAFYPDRPVHERLEAPGPTGRLDGVLLHYTANSWSGFLEKQKRFASLSTAPRSHLAAWTRAPAAFLKSAVLRLGLLDGWRGIAVACAQGYYAFHKYRK